MSDAQTVIEEEELEFLLQASDSGYLESEPDLSDKRDQITIRGDLDKISLTDIFQTLAMSKMEGVLRIFNPLEQRLVYFTEAGAQLLYANRSATRRLGIRLVQGGLIEGSALRSALLTQSREYAPLGEILIGEGAITEEELCNALDTQHEEDLYALFTWQSGSFEFYKGPPGDALIGRYDVTSPCFEINGILLEVARRADEWHEILAQIGSLDCIPVFPENVDLPAMSGGKLTACEAIDEYSTVREIGDLTMLGLFNTAKAVCELHRERLIEFADPPYMLRLAHEAANKKDYKRALQICQSLVPRAKEIDFELAEELAEVLRACRESRLGATILISCAQALPDLEARLHIGEQALRLDPHSLLALRFQHTQYRELERTTEPRFAEVVDQLCTALVEIGEYDEGLRVFQDLENLRPEDQAVLTRKAGLLQRVGRTTEALDLLMKVRRLAEADGDTAGVARVCDQILKIDPSRKDIAKALKDIRDGKSGKRRQKIRNAAAIALVMVVVWFSWNWVDRSERFDSAVTAIRERIEMHDTAGAKRLLAKAQVELGEGEMWTKVRDEIEVAIKNAESNTRSNEEKRVRSILAKAKARINANDLGGALGIYEQVLGRKTQVKVIGAMIKTGGAGDLRTVWDRIKAVSDEMHADIPGPVPELAKLDELRPAAARLLAKSKLDLTLANMLLEHAENKTLVALMEANDRQNAVDASKQILATAESIRQRYLEYDARIKQLEKNHRLDPVYEAARKAEADFDFESAEKRYRQLFDAFRGNATLAPRFQDKVAKYAAINKTLRLLIKATQDADFLEARAHYRHLRVSYKDIPWAKLVRLPVRVVSTPPGAQVIHNDKPAGQSPLILLCLPGGKNEIEITLDGFLRERTEFVGDEVGLVRSILTRSPLWTIHTKGVVEREPTGDADMVFMVDRAGGVVAWSATTRKQVWRRDLGGLSGLLTRPVLYKGLVVVGSIDGPLRALDRATGEVAWQIEDLPCVSTPVVYRSTLALATTKGQFVRIDLQKGTVRSQKPLGGRPDKDTVLFDNCALIVLGDGTARAIRIDKNVDRWSTPAKLERGVQSQPIVTDNLAIFSTDEGHLSAHDLQSGRQVWHRSGLGELRWRPIAGGDRLYVAALQTKESLPRVLSFDPRTGTPRETFDSVTGAHWSADLGDIGGVLLCGDRNGVVTVLEKRTLEVLFKIQGTGASTAAPTALPSGEILCPFDGKDTLVLPPLK